MHPLRSALLDITCALRGAGKQQTQTALRDDESLLERLRTTFRDAT